MKPDRYYIKLYVASGLEDGQSCSPLGQVCWSEGAVGDLEERLLFISLAFTFTEQNGCIISLVSPVFLPQSSSFLLSFAFRRRLRFFRSTDFVLRLAQVEKTMFLPLVTQRGGSWECGREKHRDVMSRATYWPGSFVATRAWLSWNKPH